MAQTALTQLKLERVIWIPSGCPPHKSSMSVVSLGHREEMVRRAIAGNPAFVLKSIERASNASYAIDTLSDLQALYPETDWYWIIGLDAFQTLPRWYRRQELIPAIDWLVAPRGDLVALEYPTEQKSPHFLCQQVESQLESQFIPIRWQILSMPVVGISSSLIRSRCCQNLSIRYLVPEAVRSYIIEQQLYRCDRSSV